MVHSENWAVQQKVGAKHLNYSACYCVDVKLKSFMSWKCYWQGAWDLKLRGLFSLNSNCLKLTHGVLKVISNWKQTQKTHLLLIRHYVLMRLHICISRKYKVPHSVLQQTNYLVQLTFSTFYWFQTRNAFLLLASHVALNSFEQIKR